VASLPELVELAFPLLAPGGLLVAWKRGEIDEELAAARRAMTAMGGGTLETRPIEVSGLTDHRLVLATAAGRAPAQYPRDPAARRRRPW
jgi:16S rRNA (guanine527-N7)-methyltransferase